MGMKAAVIAFKSDTGTYDLDCKSNALPQKMRPPVDRKTLSRPLPCCEKRPVVGDIVKQRTGKKKATDGVWILRKEEHGEVVDVDADGDFKLRNSRGMVSDKFFYRTDFVYTQLRRDRNP